MTTFKETNTIVSQIDSLSHSNLMRFAKNIGIDSRRKKSDQLKQEIVNKISNDITQLSTVPHFSYFGNKDRAEMKESEEIAQIFKDLSSKIDQFKALADEIKGSVQKQPKQTPAASRKEYDNQLLAKVQELKKQGASRYRIKNELGLTWYSANKYFEAVR